MRRLERVNFFLLSLSSSGRGTSEKIPRWPVGSAIPCGLPGSGLLLRFRLWLRPERLPTLRILERIELPTLYVDAGPKRDFRQPWRWRFAVGRAALPRDSRSRTDVARPQRCRGRLGGGLRRRFVRGVAWRMSRQLPETFLRDRPAGTRAAASPAFLLPPMTVLAALLPARLRGLLRRLAADQRSFIWRCYPRLPKGN